MNQTTQEDLIERFITAVESWSTDIVDQTVISPTNDVLVCVPPRKFDCPFFCEDLLQRLR